jgi:hypothetical protein
MKKPMMSACTALFVFFVNLMTVGAQEAATTTKPPIFGTYVPAKDTAQSKFRLRPAFGRFGMTAGSFMGMDSSYQRGGAVGLRAELGFTNQLSLVANAEIGRINQTTLALHWQPFNNASSRWQPYFGAGWSATAKGNTGSLVNNVGRGGFGKHGGFDGFDNFNSSTIAVSHGLALQTGFNYLLARKVIAHIDATYQVPLNTTVTKVSTVGLRFGISRQF